MKLNVPVLILILYLTVPKVNCQFNPCPNIFQYGEDHQSRFGIISISGHKQGNTELKVTIAFQKAPVNDPNNPINIEYLKSFLNTRLDALSGRDVQYRIRFPLSDYWPFPSKITLNGYTICSAEAENMWRTTYTQLFTYPKGPEPVKNNPINYCPDILKFYSNSQENYGIVTIPSPREGTTNIKVFLSIYEDPDNNEVPKINFLKSIQQTIEDAKTTKGIQYKLKLPQYEYWPIVTKITLNENTICNGPEVTQLLSFIPRVNYEFPKLTGNGSPVITIPVVPPKPKENSQFNPCPNIFQYGQDSQSRYGIISISGRRQGSSVVKVTISFQKEPVNDPNNPINIEYLKSFLNTRLDAISGRDVQYQIRFPPSDYWPFPSKITLNNDIICSAEDGKFWKITYTKRFNYPKAPQPIKNNPINYCPDILEFYSNSQENYGVVTIPSPREGTTNIQVFLSIYENRDNSKEPTINFLKSVRQTIEDAKTTKGIQYKLKLPQYEYWPVVTKITLNENTICNGQEVTQLDTWNPSLKYDFPKLTENKSPVITIPVVPLKPKENPVIPVAKQPDNPDWLKSYKTESTCGAVFADTSQLNPSELVFGGKTIKPGEYPWLVALLTDPVNSNSFFCGASLVSEGHAITAAHCTRNRQTIFLQFGRHDFSINENMITRTANGIREHPEYVNLRAHADIAVISFEPISFTSRIKPICLWRYQTKFDKIIKNGTVVGWGRYDTRDLGNSDVPKQAVISRVNLDQCRNSNDLLRSLATDQTFCAGAETATPCTGDSGGGFMVKSRNKWYLRGIISTSVGTLGSCIVENYSVFVDIIYYLDWIQGIIS